MGDFNPKWAYLHMLTEINKMGNEEKMKSMLNKYMLDPKDPKFVTNLGVALITEMRQELDKLIDWEDSPEEIADQIERKVRRWNEEEILRADVVVKSSAEIKEEQAAREESKKEKKRAEAEENKKRRAAKKQKNTVSAAFAEQKPTKVIGNVGGYSLESVITE